MAKKTKAERYAVKAKKAHEDSQAAMTAIAGDKPQDFMIDGQPATQIIYDSDKVKLLVQRAYFDETTGPAFADYLNDFFKTKTDDPPETPPQ